MLFLSESVMNYLFDVAFCQAPDEGDWGESKEFHPGAAVVSIKLWFRIVSR